VFFAQSFSEGSLNVIRSMIPRVSTKADRQAAYSILNGALMLSIIAGPGIQFGASFLPQMKSVSWLQLTSFTYPIWTALLLCIISTIIISVRMAESEPIPEKGKKMTGNGRIKGKVWDIRLRYLRLDKIALSLVLFEKIVSSVRFSAILAVVTPFMETILNKSKDTVLTIVTASQFVVGVISILAVAAFVLTPLRKVRASPVLLFSLGCTFFMFLYSYPWPILSDPITVKSQDNPDGCDATHLEWCANQWHVKVWYWLPVIIPLFGMAMPTSFISLETVYSKLLGNIDQNLMQGA
ncbi:hypothetical protein PENTCL1PPCAC_4927, partial [Pristionchus entomophagus]